MLHTSISIGITKPLSTQSFAGVALGSTMGEDTPAHVDLVSTFLTY